MYTLADKSYQRIRQYCEGFGNEDSTGDRRLNSDCQSVVMGFPINSSYCGTISCVGEVFSLDQSTSSDVENYLGRNQSTLDGDKRVIKQISKKEQPQNIIYAQETLSGNQAISTESNRQSYVDSRVSNQELGRTTEMSQSLNAIAKTNIALSSQNFMKHELAFTMRQSQNIGLLHRQTDQGYRNYSHPSLLTSSSSPEPNVNATNYQQKRPHPHIVDSQITDLKHLAVKLTSSCSTTTTSNFIDDSPIRSSGNSSGQPRIRRKSPIKCSVNIVSCSDKENAPPTGTSSLRETTRDITTVDRHDSNWITHHTRRRNEKFQLQSQSQALIHSSQTNLTQTSINHDNTLLKANKTCLFRQQGSNGAVSPKNHKSLSPCSISEVSEVLSPAAVTLAIPSELAGSRAYLDLNNHAFVTINTGYVSNGFAERDVTATIVLNSNYSATSGNVYSSTIEAVRAIKDDCDSDGNLPNIVSSDRCLHNISFSVLSAATSIILLTLGLFLFMLTMSSSNSMKLQEMLPIYFPTTNEFDCKSYIRTILPTQYIPAMISLAYMGDHTTEVKLNNFNVKTSRRGTWTIIVSARFGSNNLNVIPSVSVWNLDTKLVTAVIAADSAKSKLL